MLTYFAGYQEVEWFDSSRERKILAAIWYPTNHPETNVTYLAHFHSQASIHAPFLAGKFPLVIISHGSSGHRYNQYYLAEALARTGYVAIAIEHTGDTAFDNSLTDYDYNHIYRIYDVLFTYQQAVNSDLIGKSINPYAVAHIGHSFGGFNSYLLAGGLSSIIPTDLSKTIQFLSTKILKCIVMLAPAHAETLLAQQTKIPTPTLLITADDDELLGHSPKNYLTYFSHVKHINYLNTGHFVFLMQCPEAVAVQCPEVACDRGIPRALLHPKLNEAIKIFLNNHLKV